MITIIVCVCVDYCMFNIVCVCVCLCSKYLSPFVCVYKIEQSTQNGY